jgi:hypothetical protein
MQKESVKTRNNEGRNKELIKQEKKEEKGIQRIRILA